MIIYDLITLLIKSIHPMDFFMFFFKAPNLSELNLTFALINIKHSIMSEMSYTNTICKIVTFLVLSGWLFVFF